ncbi:hypothetical protein [Ligaoa zhengdingensis]
MESTFAWFTDAEFADINFQAGALDISVSDEMGGMAPLGTKTRKAMKG